MKAKTQEIIDLLDKYKIPYDVVYSDYVGCIVYEDKELVGYFMLAKQEDGHYDLNNLAVLPEKRHLGYGAKMIEFAKQKVTELGGKNIKVGIIDDSWIIKNYYQWNGFVHIGTQKYDHLPFTVGYLEWNAEEER